MSCLSVSDICWNLEFQSCPLNTGAQTCYGNKPKGQFTYVSDLWRDTFVIFCWPLVCKMRKESPQCWGHRLASVMLHLALVLYDWGHSSFNWFQLEYLLVIWCWALLPAVSCQCWFFSQFSFFNYSTFIISPDLIPLEVPTDFGRSFRWSQYQKLLEAEILLLFYISILLHPSILQ